MLQEERDILIFSNIKSYNFKFFNIMKKSDFEREKYGYIELIHSGKHIAGSLSTFKLVYTTGVYGMDDLGGLKILFRYACDQSPLQTDDPCGIGYTTASASNGASVEITYYRREAERPWYKMLRIRIAGRGLDEGEKIIIKMGDNQYGSPGMRLQTFVESEFEFRTLVDVFSTNVFKRIKSPKISITSGKPVNWKAVLPTLRGVNQKFSLKIRGEDKWGNPSDKIEGIFHLGSNLPINNLPSTLQWEKGKASHIINDLQLFQIKDDLTVIKITLLDEQSKKLTISNPLVIEKDIKFLHYWGDIHGQSEETIGTNTAWEYFLFARDYGFLDVTGHQGNDFQITKDLWKKINELSEEFNDPGRFITLIGYEYSANTALGGDRNVYFLNPHQQIHRSSHALIEDKSDLDTDCRSVTELFEALVEDNPEYYNSVVVIAHVGGRYADILNYHDGRLETSIEIHSAWGTFEWLLRDAFLKDFRVGIVANGDDHKGRPGAAYPGASKFGSLGGLTCFLIKELSRKEIFEALKRRHHYATTGERIFLEVIGLLNCEAKIYERDPAVYPTSIDNFQKSKIVQMGDIIQLLENDEIRFTLKVKIEGKTPIERIELFNGLNLIETIKPFMNAGLGTDLKIQSYERIRIMWEGAEFRARRRNVEWNGSVEFIENKIEEISTFNFWNVDAQLRKDAPNLVSWNTMTSGNFQGFDVILAKNNLGTLKFQSSQIDFEIPISKISVQEKIYPAGGLGKQVRIFRLPKVNPVESYNFEKEVEINPSNNKDERFWIKITFEDGHQAWSSPIYIINEYKSI